MEEFVNQKHAIDVRENRLLALYKEAFPMVAKFISRRGGGFDQAKDIFQDALVIWYEKAACNEGKLISDKAYVFGIAKHLWLRAFGSNGFNSDLKTDLFPEIEDFQDESFSSGRLLALLEYSGQKCLQLLKSFYYDRFSMLEVAQTFGFKTERSATVQKYKCLEKVRDTVKEKALQYEDFLE
ncbi:RNA polymerase sigma factor [Desertivirga arenae]|uniref:RNA polymerase sigma factor n=1 Tax=Desertivirga arenae TaxID=2810309 RepID=UPI001A96893E|nr:sigma-70 family RNA polymerase sigma factor [Pedobacter sp. SYSU D00823]